MWFASKIIPLSFFKISRVNGASQPDHRLAGDFQGYLPLSISLKTEHLSIGIYDVIRKLSTGFWLYKGRCKSDALL